MRINSASFSNYNTNVKTLSNNSQKNPSISFTARPIIVMFAPPNGGKGTYSYLLSKWLGIPQISVGNILKQEVKQGSKLGQMVKGFMDAGKFAPDDLISKVLKSRVSSTDCAKGFILDGFPRTENQAKELDKLANEIPDSDLNILNINVRKPILFERSANRMICSDCSKSFNIQKYLGDNCDDCGGKLIKRSDDKPEVLQDRLKEFDKKTMPILDHYKDQGHLFDITPKATKKKDTDPARVVYKILRLLGEA